MTASNRNGAVRAAPNRAPPNGGPAIPAAKLRASLAPNAWGSCPAGTSCPTAAIEAGSKVTASTPVATATVAITAVVAWPVITRATRVLSRMMRIASQTSISVRRFHRSASAPPGTRKTIPGTPAAVATAPAATADPEIAKTSIG